MKTRLLALLLLSLATGAVAQPAVDSFSRCLAENTTGRDRKDLARWLFVAMGAHPEMRAIASIAESAPVESSRTVGQLFTKLIADACPSQAKAALQAVGPMAMQAGFTVLGQLAMQELMADKDVAAGMALLERHIDTARLQSVMGSR